MGGPPKQYSLCNTIAPWLGNRVPIIHGRRATSPCGPREQADWGPAKDSQGDVQFTHGLLGLNPEPQRFTAGHVGIREAIILDLGISHKP